MSICRIAGIVIEHGKDNFGYWEGSCLTEAEENAIWNILNKHDTEGCSIKGTRKEIAKEVNNMKASKVNAINKIAIKGDRNEPIIAAIQNIKINHPELYKELSKVIDVELWDGYSLMIHEEIE